MPVIDEVQEAISKGKDFSYKIKLPDKTEFSIPIWDTGTQEAFLIHVQQAKSLRKAIASAIGPKSRKDAKDPNQSSPDDLKASLKDALLEKNVALEAKATAAEGFFSLYANLLSEDARFRWDKIVASQVGAAPGPTYKGTSTKRSVRRVWSPFRIASPSTSWTCSPAMLLNSSASILAMC